MKKVLNVNTPGDYCQHVGIPAQHPLVAVIDFSSISPMPSSLNNLGVYGLFMHSKLRDDLTYGTRSFDSGKGTLVCAAPGQIYGREDTGDLIELDGWGLLFHPDLLICTHLEKEIHQFSFFDYSANEGLVIEDAEKEKLNTIIGNIQDEISNGIQDGDKDNIIVGYISTLLHYCNRFYNRQFATLRRNSDDILVRLSKLINDYFNSGKQLTDGLPSVAYFADKMCMSPSYFNDMMKKTTGESAGNFIRSHIIRIAKNRLVAVGNVSQVAYDLGFDYPQHFSRMFKNHTGITPTQYVNGTE
jgi:hypothetical protein